MEEFLDQEALEFLKLIIFFIFIVMTAVGINNTIEVLRLRHEFLKINFENQFEVQRFTRMLIDSRIPSLSIKIMLLKGLREDCANQNYDHLVTKIDVALNELKRKG
jgi:hypothetical protein